MAAMESTDTNYCITYGATRQPYHTPNNPCFQATGPLHRVLGVDLDGGFRIAMRRVHFGILQIWILPCVPLVARSEESGENATP